MEALVLNLRRSTNAHDRISAVKNILEDRKFGENRTGFILDWLVSWMLKDEYDQVELWIFTCLGWH